MERRSRDRQISSVRKGHEQLIRRINSAEVDQSGWAEFVRQTTPIAVKTYRSKGYQEADVQDALQSAYEALFRTRDTLPADGDDPIKYVRRVTNFRIQDIYRKEQSQRKRNERFATDPSQRKVEDDIAAAVISDMTREETREILTEALQILTPKQAEIIHMLYYEEMSFSEAAQKLGIPLGTAKTRGRDALIKLRTHMNAHGIYPA